MPAAEGGAPDLHVLLRLETTLVQVAVFQEWIPARAASAPFNTAAVAHAL